MKINLCSVIIIFRLAVVAMAGLASEGLKYDKVVGQSADLFTLQVPDPYLTHENRFFTSLPSTF